MSKGKPEGGYDFGSKRHYRRSVWAFADECLIKPRSQRKVLILDTSDAQECLFLIEQKGYRPQNIHAVNKNPAELAWLTRRLRDEHGIHGVQTHTGDAFDVLITLIESLDAVNLDLTGCVNPALSEKLRAIPTHDDLFISVTALRGREQLTDYMLAAGFTASARGLDGRPLRMDGEDLFAHLDPVLAAQYRSAMAKHATALDVSGPSDNEDSLTRGHDRIRLNSLLIGDITAATQRIGLKWGRYRSTAGSQTMLWLAQSFMDMSYEMSADTPKGRERLERAIRLKDKTEPEWANQGRAALSMYDSGEMSVSIGIRR